MSDNETLRDTFASGPHTDSASDRSGNPPCQDFLRKNLTLTDAEREALERLCEAVVEYAADDRQTNGETFAAGDEHAVTVVRALLARLGGGA